MNESIREISPVEKEEKRPSLMAEIFTRLIKEKPLGSIGGIIVLILLFTALFANLLAPYGINEIHLTDRLQAPSTQYFMGTDNLGRDLMSRIIFGARISMYVGLGGSLLCTTVATVIGLISGYFGGKVDMAIQRFVDAWMCFPPLFILLTIMAILGPGLIQVILVLGVARGIRQSRIIRGAVISISQNVYVEAAKAIGASNFRILISHILPNVMAPVITILAVSTGYMILSEASLSFLGFGIPPPTPSWGGMLSGSGRQYMYQAPWMMMWPGAVLATVIYGMNMFGDAIRDILDPRLVGGLGRFGAVKRKIKT